ARRAARRCRRRPGRTRRRSTCRSRRPSCGTRGTGDRRPARRPAPRARRTSRGSWSPRGSCQAIRSGGRVPVACNPCPASARTGASSRGSCDPRLSAGEEAVPV
ncbi:MAG: hypothetical protein AVDCRST_MAG54-276, partial [uncultured Actinomycetospora sp.]